MGRILAASALRGHRRATTRRLAARTNAGAP
jgi:hypothetical protein